MEYDNLTEESIRSMLDDISSSNYTPPGRNFRLMCGYDGFAGYLTALYGLTDAQHTILIEILPGGLYDITDDPLIPFRLDGVDIDMDRMWDLINNK